MFPYRHLSSFPPINNCLLAHSKSQFILALLSVWAIFGRLTISISKKDLFSNQLALRWYLRGWWALFFSWLFSLIIWTDSLSNSHFTLSVGIRPFFETIHPSYNHQSDLDFNPFFAHLDPFRPISTYFDPFRPILTHFQAKYCSMKKRFSIYSNRKRRWVLTGNSWK